MQLLTTLYIQSNLFLIPELCLLILLCLHRVLAEVILFSEVHELLTKIHDILDYAVCKHVGNTAHVYHFLNPLPGSTVKSGLHSFPFFTILKTMFLLVRLVFIVT